MRLTVLALGLVCVGCGPTDDAVGQSSQRATEISSDMLEIAFPGETGEVGLAVAGTRGLVEFEGIHGEAVHEGDILLDVVDDSKHAAEEQFGDTRAAAVAATGSEKLWPDGVVPYLFHESLEKRPRVQRAMAHWEDNTSIRFVERTDEDAWVMIRPGSGCSATVGRRGGEQYVNLSDRCTKGNVIHEFGHTIGLWHEQSRHDRDAYVTVNFDNVSENKRHNFVTKGVEVLSYNYGSIMHYPSRAFSANGEPTLVPTFPGIRIGQRDGLSAGDIAAVEQLYGKACGETFDATDLPRVLTAGESAMLSHAMTVAADVRSDVSVSVQVQHEHASDVEIWLQGPDGQRYPLWQRAGGERRDVRVARHALGQLSPLQLDGEWTIEVTDHETEDGGALLSWSMTVCSAGATWSGSAEPRIETMDHETVCGEVVVDATGDAAEAQIDIVAQHDWRAALEITLEHDSIQQQVFDRGALERGPGDIVVADQHVNGFGGDATGTWRLCITDTDGEGDRGVLERFRVHN